MIILFTLKVPRNYCRSVCRSGHARRTGRRKVLLPRPGGLALLVSIVPIPACQERYAGQKVAAGESSPLKIGEMRVDKGEQE
ncbi:MAG: hypothetical protein NVS2B12_00260 [Ktedonobacteraceae bacterium]